MWTYVHTAFSPHIVQTIWVLPPAFSISKFPHQAFPLLIQKTRVILCDQMPQAHTKDTYSQSDLEEQSSRQIKQIKSSPSACPGQLSALGTDRCCRSYPGHPVKNNTFSSQMLNRDPQHPDPRVNGHAVMGPNHRNLQDSS